MFTVLEKEIFKQKFLRNCPYVYICHPSEDYEGVQKTEILSLLEKKMQLYLSFSLKLWVNDTIISILDPTYFLSSYNLIIFFI